MKKLLSIAAICAMAMVTMVSCGGNGTEPAPQPTTPTVNVTVDKATIAPAGTATVTLTATAALSEAVEFTLTSNNPDAATVADKVTIAKDAKSATVEVKGVADGKATITAATTSQAVKMGVSSVEVNVTGEAPSAIVVGNGGFTSNPTEFNNFFPFDLNCVEWTDSEGNPYTTYQTSCIWVHNYEYNDSKAQGSIYYTTIDNYGNKMHGTVDGNKVLITLVDKDTPIKESEMVDNANYNIGFYMAPILYSSDYTANVGKSGYVVYIANYISADGMETVTHRMWVEVSVADNGAVTIGKFAICTDDTMEFKAGQES